MDKDTKEKQSDKREVVDFKALTEGLGFSASHSTKPSIRNSKNENLDNLIFGVPENVNIGGGGDYIKKKITTEAQENTYINFDPYLKPTPGEKSIQSSEVIQDKVKEYKSIFKSTFYRYYLGSIFIVLFLFSLALVVMFGSSLLAKTIKLIDIKSYILILIYFYVYFMLTKLIFKLKNQAQS